MQFEQLSAGHGSLTAVRTGQNTGPAIWSSCIRC